MTGTEILDRAIEIERQAPRFNRLEPRVSSIGLCPRRQVAVALGMLPNGIPWIYSESGRVLQDRAFQRIQYLCPDAEQDVQVETIIPGVYCHPDIIVPSLKHCIQVKGDEENDSFGVVSVQYRDQVMMEWICWRHSRRFFRSDDIAHAQPLATMPESYEILFLGRGSYGDLRLSVPIRWDNSRTELLCEKFRAVAYAIELGKLPKRPDTKQPDCRPTRDKYCEYYSDCWK